MTALANFPAETEELIRVGLIPESCRVCGCTDDAACVTITGEPCRWLAPGLCSRCAVAPVFLRVIPA